MIKIKIKRKSLAPAVAETTRAVAQRYRGLVDWTGWFRVVECLGVQCNGRKDRFDKADILEQAIEICSRGRLKWVDEIGRDHRDHERSLDIEFKFGAYSLFTPTGKPKKTVEFKIKNSLGETKTNQINNPANYYMFAQHNAIGIISYREMLPHLINVSDGVSTRLPHDKITYIITPQDPCPAKMVVYTPPEREVIGNVCLNYKAGKRAMQRDFIYAALKSTGSES
jgi:hypothetical protein